MRLIDLIRHGEPVGGHRYRGQRDDPLSERGWRQMWSAVGEEAPWRDIVTSPLQRCSAFAHALAERHDIVISQQPAFKEVGFGVWEGRTAVELDAEQPGVVDRFYHDPVTQRPQGAEPLAKFVERVVFAWNALVHEDAGAHTLVVAHAGVIRCVVTHILGVPLSHLYRLSVPHAGITRIRLQRNRPPAILFHGNSTLARVQEKDRDSS